MQQEKDGFHLQLTPEPFLIVLGLVGFLKISCYSKTLACF